MRFIFKIYSGYDGFSPKRIRERLLDGRHLRLGWKKYIEVVEPGHEVCVYFHGPHRFEPGVYIRGFVSKVQVDSEEVWLRVRGYRVDEPLTEPDVSARISGVVAQRGRQVFLYPRLWDSDPNCTVASVADSCAQRLCDTCPNWQHLRLIGPRSIVWPHRLNPETLTAFVPSYWVIPSRCFLHTLGTISRRVQETSDLFMRFKVGEEALAYPLARGMYEALRSKGLLEFDAIVPVPLSPDKKQLGELHRTKTLSRELARLLGTRIRDRLRLKTAVSKRRLRGSGGLSARQFERTYSAELELEGRLGRPNRVLLVDDVCTEGSTLKCAAEALRTVCPDTDIVATTAGQMIMKAVVRHPSPLLDL